jgi:osmoprotectant transport system substrate-binding protein
MRARLVAAGLTVTLAMSGCGSDARPNRALPNRAAITVASFSFAESRTLAEIYAQALERNGYPVRRALDLASREIVEPALEQGAVDLAPEYLGTILAFVDPVSSAERLDPAGMRARLQSVLGRRGLDVLTPAPGANQNGLAVTRETAQRLHVTKVSQLAPLAGSLVLGGPPECPERPFCLPGFTSTYGLRFKAFRPLDSGGPRTVAALQGAEIEVGVLFTTDGTLGGAAPDMVLLEDDLHLQPSENVVPIVRRAVVLRRGPAFVARVDRVSAQLQTGDLIALNRRVEIDAVTPAHAASEWLRAHGF